jgi:small subunit ribosomal protein S9
MAEKYTYTIGRRKTAHATVRLYKAKGESTINGKPVKDVYQREVSQKRFDRVFKTADLNPKDYYFTVKVAGSGVNAQLEAIQLGIARAIAKNDPDKKKQLKDAGFITRDPRMVERKKTGLRKARKAEQFSKR